MAAGILRVDGERVVDEKGNTVILRGAGLGGWMNMENFITGYPGHESQHRAAMLKVLGKDKYEFFFDKWLEYHFTEKDAKFFAGLGLNCLRLPFNYRHLEDDMNPRVLKVEGFKHLDRVIELCAKEGIYTILDMHTVPGAQNPDWHSDNPTNWASFWDYRDHQDRTVWLWQRIAERYRDNAWVAGYNPINEPCDPEHWRLPAFYERLEPAIREIDPHHILWLDGNTFAMEWRHFERTLPNCVYALHDYSMMGFPKGERFAGTEEQKVKLQKQFRRKAQFMAEQRVPIWNGEFGPVYANPDLDQDAAAINEARYGLLAEQLRTYDKYQIHWSIWLYKDIGLQGMLHTAPETPWMRLVAPWLDKKRALQLDAWGRYPSAEAEAALQPLVEWMEKVNPAAGDMYPTPWGVERQLLRATLQTFLARSFSDEFAELFRGKTTEELEALAHSFHFDECVQRDGLNKAMSEHAAGRRGVAEGGEAPSDVLRRELAAERDEQGKTQELP